MRFAVSVFAVGVIAGLAGCSGSAQQPEFKQRTAEPVQQDHPNTIRDLSRMLPPKGLKHSGIVMNHVAELAKLPGGTVGDYVSGKKNYQIFIVDAATNQRAAFLLLDAKGVLKEPEYLSSFGGYFGNEGARPVFVFAKGQYLAGIVGLTRDQADPIARVLASRLR